MTLLAQRFALRALGGLGACAICALFGACDDPHQNGTGPASSAAPPAPASAAASTPATQPTAPATDPSPPAPNAIDASAGATEAGADASPCGAPPLGPPAAAPYSFEMGGQTAWSHDEGFAAGYFHTFDALDVGVGHAHKVHVLVPRPRSACDGPYPVLYFNDGDTTFWPRGAGQSSWHVAETLDSLYRQGVLPQVLVVAIVPNDREYEYSHAPWSPTAACCGIEEYTRFVADGVKRFVDAHYPTRTEARSTTILGSSRGGLAAFSLATRRPDVFGRAACLSPSFWAGLDPLYGGTMPGGPLASSPLLHAAATALADSAAHPHFWIDWGLLRTGGFQNESIEAAATARSREIVTLLTTTYGYVRGRDLGTEEDPAGGHDETSWARRLPDALRFLFGP